MTYEPIAAPRGPANLSATTNEQLRRWLWEDFDLDVAALDPVGYGADEAAELWRATCVDATRYAVKLTAGGTPAGLVVSAQLARSGVAGVVEPVGTRDGRLCSVRRRRWLSVVPWVSDNRALSSAMGAAHWRSYGALLAGLHTMPVTGSLTEALPAEEHTHQPVVATAQAVNRRLVGSADEPSAGDDLLNALAQEWHAATGVVSTLIEQADSLGRELRGQQGHNVVCHGDPHLGNLLLTTDEGVCLIDWDDAVLAPRERDLMFILGGVLASDPVTARQQSWFFDGYGPVDIDPVRLAYHRCTRALEDVVYPAAQVIDVDRQPDADRAEALSIIRGVLSPTGLVRLALSSLWDLGRIGDPGPANGSGSRR